MNGKCCCVTSDACKAPANYSGTVATRCFNCGDYVCRACSRVQTWRRWNRKRVCDNCRVEDGNRGTT